MATCIQCDCHLGKQVEPFCSHKCEVEFYQENAPFKCVPCTSVLPLNQEDTSLPYYYRGCTGALHVDMDGEIPF